MTGRGRARRRRRVLAIGGWLAAFAAAWGAIVFATTMPGASFVGIPPPLEEAEAALVPRLKGHVEALAGAIGERNAWRPGTLDRAAEYIERAFRASGLDVHRQSFAASKAELAGALAAFPFGGATWGAKARGLPDTIAFSNLEVEVAGAEKADEIVVVGAHYDTVPGCPGANDNGSGVAAVLELARLLKGERPARTVRFVAFVNEEPPFFQTGLMGSRVYAKEAKQKGERVVAMLSIETIGFYDRTPGSQRYPFPFRFFYSDRADFIGFVANVASRALLRDAIAAFRRATPFPSEGLSAPALVPGVDWSDHASFWEQGVPAVMVTDTAPYRYPHYHLPSDTPDRLDYESLARVVAGLKRVVLEIADGARP